MNKIRMFEPDSGMFLITAYEKIHYSSESLNKSLHVVFKNIFLHSHQVTNLYREHFLETQKLSWREKGIMLNLISGVRLLQQYIDENNNQLEEIERSIDSLVELELIEFLTDLGILKFQSKVWSKLSYSKIKSIFRETYGEFIFDIFTYKELSLEAKAMFFYIKSNKYYQIDRASIFKISKEEDKLVRSYIDELQKERIIKANSEVIYALELIQTKEQLKEIKSKMTKNLDNFIQFQSSSLFTHEFIHQFRPYFSNLSVYQVACITDYLTIVQTYDLADTEQNYEFLHPLLLSYQFESKGTLSYLFSISPTELQIQLLIRMLVDGANQVQFEEVIKTCSISSLLLLYFDLTQLSSNYHNKQSIMSLIHFINLYLEKKL